MLTSQSWAVCTLMKTSSGPRGLPGGLTCASLQPMNWAMPWGLGTPDIPRPSWPLSMLATGPTSSCTQMTWQGFRLSTVSLFPQVTAGHDP